MQNPISIKPTNGTGYPTYMMGLIMLPSRLRINYHTIIDDKN